MKGSAAAMWGPLSPRATAAVTAVLGLLLPPAAAAAGTITGKVATRGMRDHGDVVVYVEKIPGKSFPAPKDAVIIDQRNLVFVPHVVPVLAGTTVGFPNSDEVRHNVFSPSPAKRFNLGTYAQGVTRTVVFDKPGEVALLCNVHAEMSAYVLVLETPYFAVTAKDGTYTIPNVPPGKYVLRTWHEKLKSQNRTIEVTTQTSARADFDLQR